jgi:hypothetical protein
VPEAVTFEAEEEAGAEEAAGVLDCVAAVLVGVVPAAAGGFELLLQAVRATARATIAAAPAIRRVLPVAIVFWRDSDIQVPQRD